MADIANTIDALFVTDEHADMFIRLFWDTLMHGSLEDLADKSPIGPAEHSGDGPLVFWGVPRVTPGFIALIYEIGHGTKVCISMAQVKQVLQAKGAGLIPKKWTSSAKAKKYPFDRESVITWFKAEMKFVSPGAAKETKEASIRVEVDSRREHDSERHYSVKRIAFQWL